MDAAAKEKRRVLDILEAHRDAFESCGSGCAMLLGRVINLIDADVDLTEEMKRPPADRAMGFHWPDEES